MSIANERRSAVRGHRDDPTTRNLLGLCGAGFVAAALIGNGLAGSVDLVEADRPLAAQVGLGVEVAGLGLLLLFVAWLARLGEASLARTVAVVAGAVMAAVKLGSGTGLLAAWHEEDLPEPVVEALVAVNDAAFVLSWLPFGLLVAATAVVLAGAGAQGPRMRAVGLGLGGLVAVAGVLGSAAPALAVPVPFLLSLAWLLVASVRTVTRGPRRAGE
jgi:hypothetical protein